MRTRLSLLIAFGLFLTPIFQTQYAQAEEPTIEMAKQRLGTWEGIINGGKETRTLNIKEAKISADGSIVFTADYSITGKKTSVAKPVLQMNNGRLSLVFQTSAGTEIILTDLQTHRMGGTFTGKQKKTQEVQFWKTAETSLAPPELASLLGVWSGSWPGGLSMTITLKYVDSKSAAVHYAWGDMIYPDGNHVKAGAGWNIGEVSEKGKITFGYPGSGRVFVFTGVRQYLSVTMLGSGGNPSVIIGRQ